LHKKNRRIISGQSNHAFCFDYMTNSKKAVVFREIFQSGESVLKALVQKFSYICVKMHYSIQAAWEVNESRCIISDFPTHTSIWPAQCEVRRQIPKKSLTLV
jgi:hypothetical protein